MCVLLMESCWADRARTTRVWFGMGKLSDTLQNDRFANGFPVHAPWPGLPLRLSGGADTTGTAMRLMPDSLIPSSMLARGLISQGSSSGLTWGSPPSASAEAWSRAAASPLNTGLGAGVSSEADFLSWA